MLFLWCNLAEVFSHCDFVVRLDNKFFFFNNTDACSCGCRCVSDVVVVVVAIVGCIFTLSLVVVELYLNIR